MTEHEEALSLLRQIERNQQRGLALQAEQLALGSGLPASLG